MDKLIKQKAELNKALADMKNSFDEKMRSSEFNERQVATLKQ